MGRASRIDGLKLHFAVLRCQAGDERAFVELFEAFGQETLRYLRALVGEAAADVHQDLWIAVYRGLKSLADPRAFRTWLFRAARHRAVDHLRCQRRESELMAEMARESAHRVGDEGEASSDWRAIDLDAVLGDLTPAQREVLLLRYREDLSYSECALVVGCSVGTIRSRLHYAKSSAQLIIARRMALQQNEGL